MLIGTTAKKRLATAKLFHREQKAIYDINNSQNLGVCSIRRNLWTFAILLYMAKLAAGTSMSTCMFPIDLITKVVNNYVYLHF